VHLLDLGIDAARDAPLGGVDQLLIVDRVVAAALVALCSFPKSGPHRFSDKKLHQQ